MSKRVTTDGGGFFGGANLTTGQWRVSVYPAGAAPGRYLANCTLTIAAGQVGRFDLQIDPSRLGVASCQTPQIFARVRRSALKEPPSPPNPSP